MMRVDLAGGEAPLPTRRADVDRQAVRRGMDALGIKQNEVAPRAWVNSGYLSQIMTVSPPAESVSRGCRDGFPTPHLSI